MLIWSIQTIILSIILIFLVHHLIVFFKNTLTIPKIKDLVNTSSKYENIYNIISNKENSKINNNFDDKFDDKSVNYIFNEKDLLQTTTSIDDLKNNNTSTSIHELTYSNSNNMKNELKDFLKKQLNN